VLPAIAYLCRAQTRIARSGSTFPAARIRVMGLALRAPTQMRARSTTAEAVGLEIAGWRVALRIVE
jgi:hypothetical protein